MRKPLSLALSLLGLFDSLYLLWIYTSPTRPMACLVGTGCDVVRASHYASLWGLPVPLYGVAAYATLALLCFADALYSAGLARLMRYAVAGISGAGFLFSLYLSSLEAFVIHAWCFWCVVSAVVITLVFALGVLDVARAAPQLEPALQLVHARRQFAVFVVALVIGVPAFLWLARHGELPPVQPPSAESLRERLVRPDSHLAGNPQSPVTIIEFADFECPVCVRAQAAVQEIRARYGERIRLVFRQFPLSQIHPWAEKAAEASECAAEQGKFWEAVEKFYTWQNDLSEDALRRYAGELGLNQNRFNQCLASGSMAGRVRRDLDDGRALGVRATPTFFIGQQRIEGPLPVAQFSQLVDQELASAGSAMAKATEPAANTSPPSRRAQPATPRARTTPVPTASNPSSESAGLPNLNSGGIFAKFQAPSTACSEEEATKQQPTLIGTNEVRQLLASGTKPLFVDVRLPKDFSRGRIAGAINLPVDDLEQRWSSLPKDKTIVLYESGQSSGDICAASRAAGRILLAHGFPSERVKVYQDGLAGWEKAGLKVER